MRSQPLRYLIVFIICCLLLAPTCDARMKKKDKKAQKSEPPRHLKKTVKDPWLQKEMAFEHKLQEQASRLQAITILNSKLACQKHSESQEAEIKNNVQKGQINKANPDIGLNLADYVLEKQTRQDQNKVLFQGFFSVFRVGHFLNLENQADETILQVVSAEHGQVIYQNNLSDLGIKIDEEKGFQAHVFGNPYNPTGNINAVIFSEQDKMLHSLRLSLENSTSQEVRLLGSKPLEASPTRVMSIKSRGMNKVMVLDPDNQVQIYEETLARLESKNKSKAVFTEEDQNVLAVQQQPMSLILHTKREIGFYKLGRNEMINGKNNCQSKLNDIDQVVFDHKQPSLMIALSRAQNKILVFQAGGKGGDFGCRAKGVVRFGDSIKRTLGDTNIKSLILQSSNQLLFITFQDRQEYAVVTYRPGDVAGSILSWDADMIMNENLHQFQNLPDTSNYEISTADKNIIVRSGNQSFIFENSLTSEKLPKHKQANEESDGSMFSPETLQKFMFPLAIIAVVVYQFYFKKPASKPAAAPGGAPRSRAQQDHEISERFANLSKSLEDGGDQIDSSSRRPAPTRRGGKQVKFDDDDVY